MPQQPTDQQQKENDDVTPLFTWPPDSLRTPYLDLASVSPPPPDVPSMSGFKAALKAARHLWGLTDHDIVIIEDFAWPPDKRG